MNCRRLLPLLLLALCLTLAGCQKAPSSDDVPQGQSTAPAAEVSPVPDPTFPSDPAPDSAPAADPAPDGPAGAGDGSQIEPDSEALAALRAAAREAGALCAYNYVGYDYDTFSPAFDVSDLPALYPSNGRMDYYDAGGDDVYILTPADPAAVMRVDRLELGTDGTLHNTGTLYAGGGAPLILRCNVSDIMPNVLVTVTDSAGEVFEGSPYLSLRDGRAVLEGAYDATHYPDGMEFEED